MLPLRDDLLLRRHGFRIAARPRDSEPRWEEMIHAPKEDLKCK